MVTTGSHHSTASDTDAMTTAFSCGPSTCSRLTGDQKAMITKECFGCGNVTAHQHLHDCAHGIAETHMVGSERFVCELCGHVTRADSDGAERFPFTFDKVRRESGPAP